MNASRRVLRTPQAAEHVGLSPSTLEKYRLSGEGPIYHKSGPKIVVYYPDDLDSWLLARRRRSTSDQGEECVSAKHQPKSSAGATARVGEAGTGESLNISARGSGAPHSRRTGQSP